jgi:hypothetical protein
MITRHAMLLLVELLTSTATLTGMLNTAAAGNRLAAASDTELTVQYGPLCLAGVLHVMEC